jgi:hypothetical protein
MPITQCGPNRPSSSARSLLDELPLPLTLPASPSESAPARVADLNEWNFANHNSPHSPLLGPERHAKLKGVYEGLMTDNRTRWQLPIEERVAAERHRQLEFGGQRGEWAMRRRFSRQ